MLSDEDLLSWSRFVATKFTSNTEGWKYTRDLGGLKHIRFERDYTGRNVWWRRILSGIEFGWSHNFHARKGSFAHRLGKSVDRKKGLWRKIQGFWIYFMIRARKDSNLPDGLLNGNPVFWEENGEYGAFFGPTVGVKVLDFLEAEPNNPHAVEILKEMQRMAKLSFPGEDKE